MNGEISYFLLVLSHDSLISGISQRERTVVEQFSRNGRPCPSMLSQKKPCFIRGCYNWAVSEWSNCTAQVSTHFTIIALTHLPEAPDK